MDQLDLITEREQRIFDLQLEATIKNPTQQSAKYCTECGNNIPEKRRVALPGVQLCVGCKEVQEIKNRNLRTGWKG